MAMMARFLARIQAFEAKKGTSFKELHTEKRCFQAWPGSRVSSTLVTYNFGNFVGPACFRVSFRGCFCPLRSGIKHGTEP